jgi:DNA-binding CsgD family transcriptional regulator
MATLNRARGEWVVNALIFVYTMVLILVCFAAAMLSFAAYTVSHKRSLIPQTSFFVFYIIEMIGILCVEFTTQNLPFDPGSYYEITIPALRILTATGVMASLWIMLLDILDVHDRRMQLVPVALFCVGCCAITWGMPYGPWRQWSFYTLRQACIAFGLLFALVKWLRATDMPYRERLGKHRKRYLLLWVLLACILLEDSIVILLAPIPDTTSKGLALYLSERNISENLMMLLVAYYAIRVSVETLALRFNAPPEAPRSSPMLVGASAAADTDEATRATSDLSRHIEDIMPRFANDNGLSAREAEVLALVVEGKTNREVASTLFLSEGTVKTHVHNINKKCGTASRNELRQAFWAS